MPERRTVAPLGIPTVPSPPMLHLSADRDATQKFPWGPDSLSMPYWPWIITGEVATPAPKTMPVFQVKVGSWRQKCCMVPVQTDCDALRAMHGVP